MFKKMLALSAITLSSFSCDLPAVIRKHGQEYLQQNAKTGFATDVGSRLLLNSDIELFATKEVSYVLRSEPKNIITTINLRDKYVIVDYNSNGVFDANDQVMSFHGLQRTLLSNEDASTAEIFYKSYQLVNNELDARKMCLSRIERASGIPK